MTYIFTEDSGSGYRFWEILATSKKFQGRLKVISGGGNVPTLYSLRKAASNLIQAGDTVICA